MTRRARVYHRDDLAGELVETDDGRYRFTYDAQYDGPAIACTLPRQSQPFEADELFPFFAGLVPEGWYLRIVAPTLKVDEHDAFGLLLKTCEDCIGAVSIREATHDDP